MNHTPSESEARPNALNPKLPRPEPQGSWEGAVRAGQAGPETDGLPVAVMRTDEALRLIQANGAWHALAASDVPGVGDDWLELFETEDQERVQEAMRTVLATQRTELLEVRAGSSDQWLEVRIAPDEWKSGVYVVALDVTEQRHREALLNFYAIHDPLTGMYNRVALLEHIRAALARQRRKPSTLAVMYIDLDHFKEVNDRYGHETGDRVLVEAAQRLRMVIRPADMVARLGGDEFVAVCESFESQAEARTVAGRLVSSIEEPIQATPTDEVRLSAAVGLVFADHQTESAASLIDRADRAMYQAKKTGGEVAHAKVLPQGQAGGSAPAANATLSIAVDQLAGVEGDLLEEWARTLSTDRDPDTARLKMASRHVARAINSLRDRAPASKPRAKGTSKRKKKQEADPAEPAS